MAQNQPKRFLIIAALLFFPPIVFFGLKINHADVLSIFVTTVGLWISEVTWLPVAGLLIPVLAAIYGSLPAERAFDAFGSDILFLFLGCFLMGRAMEKHGLDKRLAYFLLYRFMPGTSFQALNVIIACSSFILSMWISNTSTTAIMTTITISILSGLESQIADKSIRDRITVRLLLSCAFASSIGGIATPVGSPPNLIALEFLAKSGIHISFIEWLMIGFPIAILMLLIMLCVFELMLPVRGLKFAGIKQHFHQLSCGLGPIRISEMQVAAVFLIVICLWILPGILHMCLPGSAWLAYCKSHLSMSVIGLSGGLVLFFLPIKDNSSSTSNISWSETEKIDWGTLMLFGGGLTLGNILVQSGAAQTFSTQIFSGDPGNLFVFACLVVIVSIIVSEFTSNTAAASMIIPLVLAATALKGLNQDQITGIVLAATFGTSFGFIFPVSTPPNAIVYGTGKVPAFQMKRAGFLLDISGACLIIALISFI